MSDEKIVIQISGNINADIATRIRAIGVAATEASNDIKLFKAELRSFGSASGLKTIANDAAKFKTEIVKANTETKKFVATLRQADSMSVRFGKSTSGLNGQLSQLAGLFGGVFALGKYIEAQDALTTIQNQIKVITDGTAEAARMQKILFDLARETRSGIEQTTTAYTNFYKQLAPIGASEAEVLRIVETLNKGFIVGGKSAAEAAGSVRQFVQGLQNGVLRGEEFNSVMEAFPTEIIDEFAKTLGVGREELRKMAEAGLITADVIRESMGNAAGAVDKLFAETIPTIGNAITNLENKFIEFTANTVGPAGKLAEVIMFIGDNLNIVIPIVGAFVGAWAVLQIAALIQGLGLLTLSLIPLTAQLLALAAVAATVVATLYSLGYIAAFAAGVTDEYDNMVAELGAYVVGLGQAMGQTVQQSLGLGDVAEAARNTQAEIANLNAQADALPPKIATFAGGVAGINEVGAAFRATTSAATETGEAVTVAAGAVASMSGQYNGVINVARALQETGKAAGEVNAGLGVTVTRLTSVSGQYNGVMSIAYAFREVAAAAKSASNNVRELANEQAAASGRNRPSVVPNGGDSSGSFVNITNNMSGNSFQDLPAYKDGGSFVVRGNKGQDKNVVRFLASDGEQVKITTRQEQMEAANNNEGGGTKSQTVNFYITTPDADSFRRSRGQISGDIVAGLGNG